MLDRRNFLRLAATLTASLGIENFPQPVAAALKQISQDKIPKLIYLQGLSCTGCSISLLQASSPSPLYLITDYSQLAFHADLSAISGKKAIDLIEKYISGQAGDYFLAVEGAIPELMPEACMIGDKPFAYYLEKAAKTMAGAVAIGACACDGGIPGAEGNLTGAIGLQEFYRKRDIDKLVINIRGCSVHPDWVWHTITHLVKVGVPELTNGAPKLFYNRKVHDTCPRYHDFQEEIFAEKLGEKGCLFKLGCLGPNTYADCSSRWWNGGQTWCIDTNAPCIGCASPDFARKKNFPFYRISENRKLKI
ncbi:MAG: hydrogenase small subunit [Proteobacteria bacterium]|nr:hydrogenase small subunit [Pseudomonadota bacterium]MBU1715846.1 hydrogenase small subunit [Pseudomonadota bacterium]